MRSRPLLGWGWLQSEAKPARSVSPCFFTHTLKCIRTIHRVCARARTEVANSVAQEAPRAAASARHGWPLKKCRGPVDNTHRPLTSTTLPPSPPVRATAPAPPPPSLVGTSPPSPPPTRGGSRLGTPPVAAAAVTTARAPPVPPPLLNKSGCATTTLLERGVTWSEGMAGGGRGVVGCAALGWAGGGSPARARIPPHPLYCPV